jgi:hypothetical protein
VNTGLGGCSAGGDSVLGLEIRPGFAVLADEGLVTVAPSLIEWVVSSTAGGAELFIGLGNMGWGEHSRDRARPVRVAARVARLEQDGRDADATRRCPRRPTRRRE